jgi:phosphatidylserine/phosphatidylglycerophosphate/cardiolipin synthase-like enzyme
MRVKDTQGGLTAMSVAGNHVVLLGWDMPEADVRALGILGFSISRLREEDGELIWMPGMKTFESVDPVPDPGVQVSSFRHPFQTFQWADYTVSPGKTYTYRIVARTGPPHQLGDGPSLPLKVTTQVTDQGKHAVFFNRGAIASQEYARRFQNQSPDIVGQAAFDWLSRGLVEGLEAFIGAAGHGSELHGAFFEFKNDRIYAALKSAKIRGATIRIIYDGDDQLEKNLEHLENSGIKSLTKARSNSGGFAHNKFLVLSNNGVAEEVWTGSTNLSQNGIFGHSNNAHIVRDATIAGQYRSYWDKLFADRTLKPTAIAVEAMNLAPPQPWDDETEVVFSPRRSLQALDWYAQIAGNPPRPLFATFAFGMDDRFVSIYDQADGVLRFALMEKKGNGKKFKIQAAQIDKLRQLPNVVVSVGNKVMLNNFDRWLSEIDRITDEAHVLYVHTKYMLIDPLGNDPVVLIGSANFSEASTNKNDENMLIIKGNKDVADIYIGEFMRLFSHYAFRESLTFKSAQGPAAVKRKFLKENVSWIDGEAPGRSYYAPGRDRALRRKYFSGQQ